jgi:protein-arginine kinase activator protein McsA
VKKLQVNSDALKAALIDRCYRCGEREAVSSVSRLNKGSIVLLGWVCKPCYREISKDIFNDLRDKKTQETILGNEGFVNDDLTVWDLLASNPRRSETG